MNLQVSIIILILCSMSTMNAQNDVEPLSWKVFTIKRNSATQDANMPGGNDELRWVANTATLIYGETDAILVDVFLTIEQSNQLVHWLYESGKNLKAIYLTHAHADHIYGAKLVTNHFPQAKVVALPAVIEDIPKEIDKEYIANLWDKLFPGNIPQEFAMPEAIQGNELEIEGHKLIVENIGFSDTGNTTYLYVPSIGLVVAGDIVYNGIHPYLKETTPETRREWIAALDKIESLHPRFVVAGHKVPENEDSSSNIKATRDYLLDFERLNSKTKTVLELYNSMLVLYPDRVNPGSLWGGAKAAKSN